MKSSVRPALIASLFLIVMALLIACDDLHQRIEITRQLAAVGAHPANDAGLSELKLEWFAKASRIDPIFALDGTDPDALAESIEYLKKGQTRFASLYPPADQAFILKTLYPLDFLTSLPDVQRAREAFLAHPSHDTASRYQKLLSTTIDAYAQDADALANATEAAATSTEQRWAFLSGYTTQPTIVATLHEIANEARAQKKKAEFRYACAIGFRSGCESLPDLAKSANASLPTAPILPAPDATTRSIDAILRQYYASWSGPAVSYAPHEAPPLLAVSSSCYPYDASYLRVWWVSPRDTSGLARKTSIANDGYLYAITPTSTYVSYFPHLYSEGARYEDQVAGHFYLCADAGKDVATTARMLGLYFFVKEHPIFAKAQSSDPLVANLSKKEASVASATTLQEADVAAYARLLAEYLATRTSLQAEQEIGVRNTALLGEAGATWRQGSWKFDEAVREAVYDNALVYGAFKKGDTMPLSFLYLSRSFASVFFLTGNPTFVPTPVSFFKTHLSYPLPLFHITSLRSLLASGVSLESILREIVKTQTLINQLGVF